MMVKRQRKKEKWIKSFRINYILSYALNNTMLCKEPTFSRFEKFYHFIKKTGKILIYVVTAFM